MNIEITMSHFATLQLLESRANEFAPGVNYRFSIELLSNGKGYIRASHIGNDFIVPRIGDEDDVINYLDNPFVFDDNAGLNSALINAQKWIELAMKKSQEIVEAFLKSNEIPRLT